MSQIPSPSYPGHAESFHYSTPMARGQGHSTLRKFLADLKSRNFDSIKYATYRTAAKLFYIQRSTNLNLIDIYNMIEAFRENGLNTLEYNAEIDEARLECIVASVFYALYKRLPSSNDIDVENNIVSLTQWIMHAYDRNNSGRIRVISIKTALTMLCNGRLVDKMRYIFTQISESSGILNVSRFEFYLRELLTLPAAVGEEPNFSYEEGGYQEFFKPSGMMDPNSANLEQFLQSMIAERASGTLFWVHMLHKLMRAYAVEHQIQCKACGRKPFNGLRYKCLECYNYHICQDCFWREKKSGSHTSDHDVREYSTWNKGEKGNSVRRRFLCSPTRTSNKLPDYPKEPEPNKTLDMSNIIPAMPPDIASPMGTMNSRMYSDHESPNSTLSFKSSNGEVSGIMSQESVGRMDDEHRLIARYAQKLASHSAESAGTSGEISKEQRDMIANLEERNRSLLREIRKLKVEHDQTVKNAQQAGTSPTVLTELKVLRQRKDELEMRMLALQETRRELMVQLEGLMKLLKVSFIFSFFF
ncbi:dystrobrevin beta-like isoform X3 [Rhopilema esculentum]|uniref:dystrobrevin beta-like isoform X3 n=1 Tax=Rhopilema esculentum TaxID=499914 RepID=UPI0031D88FC3